MTVATGGKTAHVDAPVVVEVLPFDLIGASRQYLFLGDAAWQGGAGGVAALREIGVQTQGLAGSEESLTEVLGLCRSTRLREPIPFHPAAPLASERVAEREAERREKQLPAVLWLFSSDQLPDAGRAAEAGAPVGAILGAKDPLPDPPIDTILRRVDAAAVGDFLRQPIPPMKSPGPGEPPARRLVQWWSWDTGAATPAQNRLYAGFLLWRSGFTGACIEERTTSGVQGEALARCWEAVRAGVDDVRTMTTYYSFLRQVRDKDRTNPIPALADVAVATALARLTPDSPWSTADAARRELVRWIVKLRAVVG
jgi:hypothetical protein